MLRESVINFFFFVHARQCVENRHTVMQRNFTVTLHHSHGNSVPKSQHSDGCMLSYLHLMIKYD